MLTLADIQAITNGKVSSAYASSLNIAVTGFSIDTRSLKKGEVFIALKGENLHGNAFAHQAINNGAYAVITDQPLDEDVPFILVDNALDALIEIAVYQRAQFKGKVCGVTGTVGKTSIKEALGFLINAVGLSVHYSKKSFNNHIGVPLTLASLNPNADVAVIEMGTNHPGEIAALTKLARPHMALVTAVGPGHIEFFSSVEAIAYEKVSIAESSEQGGVAVLPKDSEFFNLMKAKVINDYKRQVISFGGVNADVRLVSSEMTDLNKMKITANVFDQILIYELPTSNQAWISNSLAILAVLYSLGVSVQLAANHLAKLPLTQGRGQVHALNLNGKQITLIDDAYNANPLSMQSALETLAKYPGLKIAVIGDMRELGDKGEMYHVEIGQLCKQLNIDKVLTCGTLMKHAFQALDKAQQLAHVETYADVEPVLTAALQDGCVVLFKASNGVKLHVIVSNLLAR